MIFTELQKEEFERFIIDNPLSTCFQSTSMDNVELNNNWNAVYVGVKKDNKIIAAARMKYATVRFNKKIFYAQRGMILDYSDSDLLNFFTKNIKKYLKKQGAYAFHINPPLMYKERDINGDIVKGGIDNSNVVYQLKKLGYKHTGFTRDYDYSKQDRWTFQLDVKDITESQLLKQMSGNTRRAIQKAEHLGVKVRELKKEELYIFKDIMNSTSDRKNFKDNDLNYYEKMYDAFKPKDQIKYMLAYVDLNETLDVLNSDISELTLKRDRALNNKKEGQYNEFNSQIKDVENRIKEIKKIKEEKGDKINLASAMFMIFGNEIMYYHSGSYKEYFSFFGQYLIQWEMIKLALKLDKDIYNFYGIKGTFEKNDPDYGIYLFKRGFTGKVVEYIGDFYLPISSYYYIQKLFNFIRRR